MDSEQSAFAAAQMRHHRYMYFGKKQRYIEVFQCSGEDMSLVLSGGIPVPTAPVSPVGKTLISSGMLNAPTILPSPAAPGALTAATAAASLPQANGAGIAAAGLVQPPAGLATWDPFAALQMQQVALNPAHVHAATYRSQQENVWLQLFAQQHLQHQLQQQMQQQMQLAALAQSQKPQWPDFNGAAAAAAAAAAANQASFMHAFPPPPPLTPVNSAVVTSQAGPNSTSAAGVVNKQKSLMPSTMFPVVSTALHIPQAAGVATSSAPNQPFVLINIPRVAHPVQSYPGKMAGVTSTSTVNHAAIPSAAAAFNVPQNALISPTAQYAASSILKRSWEHAFTDGMPGAHGPGAVNVKRPYSIGTPANSAAAIFTVPPPQQSPAQISAQPAPPAVAFQPTQFFAPT